MDNFKLTDREIMVIRTSIAETEKMIDKCKRAAFSTGDMAGWAEAIECQGILLKCFNLAIEEHEKNKTA